HGTFVSHTMQQGDCNAPATFQRLMTVIFREYIRRFVHIYLDNIFVFSNSIKEHEKHLGFVFDKLRKAQLFLEESKLNLYSKKMDCLGHIIEESMQVLTRWPEYVNGVLREASTMCNT